MINVAGKQPGHQQRYREGNDPGGKKDRNSLVGTRNCLGLNACYLAILDSANLFHLLVKASKDFLDIGEHG